MGQGQFTGAIANRVDVGHIRTHVGVDLDETTLVEFHARLVQANFLGVGGNPNRDQHLFGRQRLDLVVL